MLSDPHNLLSHLNPDWFYLSGTGLPRLSWKRGRRPSTSSFTTAKFHSASRVSRHSGHLTAMLLLVKCCMTKYCRYLLSLRSRIYVTVRCPSVCLSRRSSGGAAASTQPCCRQPGCSSTGPQHGAQQQMRPVTRFNKAVELGF